MCFAAWIISYAAMVNRVPCGSGGPDMPQWWTECHVDQEDQIWRNGEQSAMSIRRTRYIRYGEEVWLRVIDRIYSIQNNDLFRIEKKFRIKKNTCLEKMVDHNSVKETVHINNTNQCRTSEHNILKNMRIQFLYFKLDIDVVRELPILVFTFKTLMYDTCHPTVMLRLLSQRKK